MLICPIPGLLAFVAWLGWGQPSRSTISIVYLSISKYLWGDILRLCKHLYFSSKFHPVVLRSTNESCLNYLLLWWLLPSGDFSNFILFYIYQLAFYCKIKTFLSPLFINVYTNPFIVYSMGYNLISEWLILLCNWSQVWSVSIPLSRIFYAFDRFILFFDISSLLV